MGGRTIKLLCDGREFYSAQGRKGIGCEEGRKEFSSSFPLLVHMRACRKAGSRENPEKEKEKEKKRMKKKWREEMKRFASSSRERERR